MYTLSWKWYSLMMAVASFNRMMCHATKQKWFRNGLRSTTTSLRTRQIRCCAPQTINPNSPDLWDVLVKEVWSMETPHHDPPHDLQDLKDLLLVESMPQRVRAYLASKWDQQNIRQVVMMLCLISVYTVPDWVLKGQQCICPIHSNLCQQNVPTLSNRSWGCVFWFVVVFL